MSSAWSQLEQLLTCAICLDRFRNPKLLPCQHTFCAEPCMEGLIDYARRQIKCPECRAEHRIPYQGVQTFPNNVTLSRFLDLHRNITGEEPEPVPSMMERCGICSEKSLVERCAHCDKKVCDECKDAHLEIMTREIQRINNQVRRGIVRLNEHHQQTEKNSEKLLQNQVQIREEITEIVRRFIKDLKDKEEKLLHELDEYTTSESRNMNKLKEDLDIELLNITSNSEFIEKNITETQEWTDVELMEYKDIFMKTLEFLRNFDPDTSDFTRKVKFQTNTDIDILRRSLVDFGELKMTAPVNMNPISPSGSNSNINSLALPLNQNALMRSQSDHRLASQLQQRLRPNESSSRLYDHTGQSRLTSTVFSDSERDSRTDRASSPTTGRRPVTDRYARFGIERSDDRDSRSRLLRDAEPYTPRQWPRPSDTEDSTTGSSIQFRSRFMRERNNEYTDDSHDSDYGSHRSVRFEEPAAPAVTQQRVKVFETDQVSRGPLSGVIKLTDSPLVMERLHQNEVRQKQKEEESRNPPPPPAPVPTPQPIAYVPRRVPSRQVSEDEIEKQKKQNQLAAAAAVPAAPISAPATPPVVVPQSPKVASPVVVPESPSRIVPRRISNLQRDDERPNRFGNESPPSQGSRRGSDGSNGAIDESTVDDDDGTRVGRRQRSTTDDDSRVLAREVSRQTSTPRSIRSPMGKNFPLSQDTTDVNTDTTKSSIRLTPTDKKDTNRSNVIETDSDGNETETDDNDDEDDDDDTKVTGVTSPNTGSVKNNRSMLSNGTMPNESSIRSDRSIDLPSSVSTLLNRSAQIRRESTDTQNKSNAPVYGRISRQTTVTEDPPAEQPYQPYRTRRPSEDTPLSPSYQTKRTLTRAATYEEEPQKYTDTAPSSTSSYTSRFLSQNRPSLTSNDDDSKYSYTRRADKYGTSSTSPSSGTSSYRSRLAKSKSSHTIGNDDSGDEDNGPISPSYRSKFTDLSSSTGAPKTSRSGYVYRTRDQSPEEESSTGSWAQYLKNKYGSNRTGSTGSSKSDPKLSVVKSRSSHALYGRSISDSSDEEVPATTAVSSYRRSSRDDTSNISSAGYGFSFPRSMYTQKKKMNMRIGTRGTEPGCFTWPRCVTVGPDNSIVVADSSNHRVQVFDSTGRFMFEFGSYGSGEGDFDCLAGVAVNRIGQYIVSDRYNHRIQVFDPSGRFLRAFGSEGRSDGRFSYPWGIATDSLGFIYVCDKENHRIQVFQSDGTFVGKFGTIGSRIGQLEHPHYVAVSNTNRVVVSDSNNHRIQIFDVNGRTLTTFGSEGSDDGQFKFPRGVAVDDQGYIIVGDSGNNRVQIFNPDGSFLKSFGTWGSGEGEFKGLEGIAVSSIGNILVCDRENHRIQIF